MWLSLFDQSTVDMTSAIAMTHALFWTGTVMFVFMGCTDADDHYIQPKGMFNVYKTLPSQGMSANPS